jgi:ceramide glucosyltransferase
MPPVDVALLAIAVAATGVHIATAALAWWQLRRPRRAPSGPLRRVSLVRTVRNIDENEFETLRSSFFLTYPDLELIFCAASVDDPAIPAIRRLIDSHPHMNARLLIGEDRFSANPKLNNMVKGWQSASSDWVIFADSNLLLPPDYVQRVLLAWTPDTGVVSAPPIGGRAVTFWSELECAFLNTYQARWQYAADAVGLGFAQGKTLCFRRDVLDRAGGLEVLATELAEDAAATKAIRAIGLKVRLATPAFTQPLGRRKGGDVLARQQRWAQLRRISFPGFYALEILSGCLPSLLAAAASAHLLGLSAVEGAFALGLVWMATEAALAVALGWHLTLMSPMAWLTRDALIPYIWLRGWLQTGYEWGGAKVLHGRGKPTLIDTPARLG